MQKDNWRSPDARGRKREKDNWEAGTRGRGRESEAQKPGRGVWYECMGTNNVEALGTLTRRVGVLAVPYIVVYVGMYQYLDKIEAVSTLTQYGWICNQMTVPQRLSTRDQTRGTE